MGMKPLGVTMDQDGVQAEALEKVLSEWNEEERGGSRPKFFILVP
jgi:aromatic amino acid aminotransferase I